MKATTSCFCLAVCLVAQCALAAADPYAPIIAASNRRREAAQQALADCRAKYDGLATRLKAIEEKLIEIAIPASDTKPAMLADQLRTLDAAFKQLDPGTFTSVEQFAQYDRMTDERSRLKAAIETAHAERWASIRRLARRTPEGAALAGQWETLDAQAIAAKNEASFAQARRDTVVRGEANLLKSLAPRADEGPAEALRLDVPPPADAAERLAQFRHRTTGDGVRELGERFFSQMTLTLPGLEPVARLVQQQQYAEALDAYKHYFFTRLLAA